MEDFEHYEGKPKSLDFWKQHESALRAGRITQAAAIIFSATVGDDEYSVDKAFRIDKLVQQKIKQEKA